MIQHRPALPLGDHLVISSLRIVPGDLEQFLLHISVAVQILPRIPGIVQGHAPDLFYRSRFFSLHLHLLHFPTVPKLTCLLAQTSLSMKVSCSVHSALPQPPPAFMIRAIALLIHSGPPIKCQYGCADNLAHHPAAGRYFHSNMAIFLLYTRKIATSIVFRNFSPGFGTRAGIRLTFHPGYAIVKI